MLTLSNIDMVWLLFCSCLLIIMQAGFVCLESGLIRTKNSINVVMKNLLDLSTAFVVFGLFGFSLMFFGFTDFIEKNPILSGASNSIFIILLFQAMFCATAITIVSGAVAERMSYLAYFFLAIFVAAIIYPTVGHWIWAGNINGNYSPSAGWLRELGFVDFAGATVVHSVGGWIALTTIFLLGPRIGRYNSENSVNTSSNITLACLGSLLIWVGWLGFNGGSLLRFDGSISKLILITLMSGSGGLFAGLLTGYIWYKKALVMPVLNGGLIGLVSVTAGANLIPVGHGLIIGFLAGLLPQYINYLMNKFKLDDAIGAVPVHLTGGIFGTLVVSFYVEREQEQTIINIFLVQLLGVVVVGLTVVLFTFVFLKLVNKFHPLRVTQEQEIMGLNIAEHNERAANADMITQLREKLQAGDLLTKLEVDPQSDSYEAAKYYNNVIGMFEQLNSQNQKALDQAVYHATHDSLTSLFNRYAINKKLKDDFALLQRQKNEYCIAVLDIDYFKSINDIFGHDIGDLALKHFAQIISNSIRVTDSLGRIGGEEFCILFNNTSMQEGKKVVEKVKANLADSPFTHDSDTTFLTFSAGIASLSRANSVSECMKQADKALYHAKANGRNQIVLAKTDN